MDQKRHALRIALVLTRFDVDLLGFCRLVLKNWQIEERILVRWKTNI